MKTLAFRAFIGCDIVNIGAYWWIFLFSIHYCSIKQGVRAFYRCTIGNRPFYPSFINSIVRALWFTGTTVDTFFRNLNSHFLKIRE